MAEYVPQAWRFGDNGYYAESYAKHMAALGMGIDYDDDDFDRYEAQFKADLAAHDRTERAAAWDEGYDTGCNDEAFEARGIPSDPGSKEHPHANPYRERGDRG